MMKLLFKDLANYEIQKLVINSIEQALYQAIVVIDNKEHLVWQNESKCFLKRNFMQLREAFEHLGIKDIVLRQESAYDEMIGQQSRQASNRLEVKVSNTAYYNFIQEEKVKMD